MTDDCILRGGFWITYSIHDQEWVPCKLCDENKECKYYEKEELNNETIT